MSITIHDYDDTWPDQFAAIGSDIRAALGDTALAIHHIGSTSVPGLGAKNIIDIQVTVADLDDPTLGPLLERAQLSLRPHITGDHAPPGMDLPDHELDKIYAGREGVNCHIRRVGAFNQRYALLCREYLRSHPTVAAAYEQIKRQLARHFVDDIEGYYDIKDPVFDVIMAGAYAWADQTSWELPLSDA